MKVQNNILSRILHKNEKEILERILTLKQIIRDKRSSPLDYHELAIYYYLLKNFDKSLNTINELISKFPDYIDIDRVTKLRIMNLIELKEYKKAIVEIENRLKFNSQDLVLLSFLAYSYEKSGDYKKSLDIHRRILNIEPNRACSLNAYGYLLALFGNSEEQKIAINYIQKALQLKPDHPYYLDSLAIYYYKMGKLEDAKKTILRALQKDPENVEIIMHFRQILEKK